MTIQAASRPTRKFGYAILWTAFFTFPLMVGIQVVSAGYTQKLPAADVQKATAGLTRLRYMGGVLVGHAGLRVLALIRLGQLDNGWRLAATARAVLDTKGAD